MGSFCSTNIDHSPSLSAFEFVYGSQAANAKVDYPPLNGSSQICLGAFQAIGKLNKSQCLYKDPYPIETVVLQGKAFDNNWMECTFHRASSLPKLPQSQAKGASSIIIHNDAHQYISMLLCFLAENPFLIDTLYYGHPSGLQVVKTGLGYVYMDDYILCDAKGMAVFTSARKLWACMLEKAWIRMQAQEHSSAVYTHSPADVFQAFLHYPVSTYKLNQDTIGMLKSKNKHCAYVLIPKKNSKKLINVAGRPYYFLFHTVDNGVNLFYMRDPSCGHIRNTFTTLTESLIKALKQNQVSAQQGNFFLSQEEMMEQIQQVIICSYNPKATNQKQIKVQLKREKDKFLLMTLDNESEVSLILKQQTYPFQPLTYQVFNLRDYTIVAGQKNVQGCFGVRNTNLFENAFPFERLHQGNYLIRIKCKSDREVKLIALSSSIIHLGQPQEKQLHNQFKRALIAKGRDVFKSKNTQKYRKQFNHVVCWIGDLLLIYIKKTNNKEKIGVQISFPELINLKSLDPIGLAKQFKILPLFQQEIYLLFEKIDFTQATKLGNYFIESL